jgi:signal transduction histidine kinase
MKNRGSRSEKELRQWKKLLDQLAHDMASPVSFLEQYVLHAMDSNEDSQREEADFNKVALRSLNKLKDMLEHMRNFSKLTEVFFDYSDFAETIRNAIAEIGPLAKKHNIDIVYNGPEHFLGKYDRKKVERMLSNLCVNAVEAMDAKGSQLNIALTNDDKSILIEVSDDGKGIPRDSIDRIFETGFTKGKKKGTGLGLAFCRGVMDAHGGSIKVFSESDSGSVFTLSFPTHAAIMANKIRNKEGSETVEAVLLNEDSEWQKELLQMLRDAYGEENIKIVGREFASLKDKKKDYTLDLL